MKKNITTFPTNHLLEYWSKVSTEMGQTEPIILSTMTTKQRNIVVRSHYWSIILAAKGMKSTYNYGANVCQVSLPQCMFLTKFYNGMLIFMRWGTLSHSLKYRRVGKARDNLAKYEPCTLSASFLLSLIIRAQVTLLARVADACPSFGLSKKVARPKTSSAIRWVRYVGWGEVGQPCIH